jgi:hypothetical protein
MTKAPEDGGPVPGEETKSPFLALGKSHMTTIIPADVCHGFFRSVADGGDRPD